MLPEDDLHASSRSRQVGRILLVACVLVLASAWWIGRWQAPLDENRDAAQYPPITGAVLLDLQAHKQLEAVVRDSIPIARLTVPDLASVGSTAGFSLRSDVWQGSDDMLFLGADFDLPCRTTSALPRLSRLLSNPQLQGDDPRIRFLIAPDKSTTLASQIWGNEVLADEQELTSCQRSQRASLDELVRQHPRAMTNVAGVPEAAAQFGEPSYFTGDSHWTPAGATAVALQLGTWIAPSHTFAPSDQLRFMHATDKTMNGGDLYRLAGLARTNASPVITTSIPGSKYAELTRPDPAIRTRSQAPGAPLTGRTLMFVDSYFNSAGPTLAPLFTDLTVISDKVDAQGYFDRHRGEFDHVVVLAAQRHAPTTFLKPARALLASLSPQPAASWAQPHWPEVATR